MKAEFWGQLKRLLDSMAAAGRLDSNVGPISRYKMAVHKPGDPAVSAAAAAGVLAPQTLDQATPVLEPCTASAQVRGLRSKFLGLGSWVLGVDITVCEL